MSDLSTSFVLSSLMPKIIPIIFSILIYYEYKKSKRITKKQYPIIFLNIIFWLFALSQPSIFELIKDYRKLQNLSNIEIDSMKISKKTENHLDKVYTIEKKDFFNILKKIQHQKSYNKSLGREYPWYEISIYTRLKRYIVIINSNSNVSSNKETIIDIRAPRTFIDERLGVFITDENLVLYIASLFDDKNTK